MEQLLFYLLKSSICLMAMYIPFRILLRKETFFRSNRFGLLAITFLSLALPLENLSWLIQEQYIYFPELIITSYKKEQIASSNAIHWHWPCTICYWVGVIFFLFKKGAEWIRLQRTIRQGRLWVHDEEGIRIHCHINPIIPFSWMNQIVISEKDYLENGKQILLHETAHIRCRHSWDIIWLSFMEILQWFNPFVWMLSKDLQDIHEFEADSYVIRQGEDARTYQLLLIEKAISKVPYTMANSFNSSPIKQRIRMMNKQASSPWAKMKHLYLIPIVLLMIGIFSPPTSANAQEGSELSPEMKETLDYIARHIKYPTDALDKGIQGKVVLELHLTENEHQNRVKVLESITPSLDAEAVRIIKETPIWKASHEGIAKHIIAVHFTLK